MKFYLLPNRDKSDVYERALIHRGHRRVENIAEAEMLFYGFEKQEALDLIHVARAKRIPIFVLPHSCECEIQWDGLHEPAEVTMTFVISDGQVEIMRRYGYPHPVEATGYPFGRIKPLETHRRVRSILFAPKHPNPGSRKKLLFRDSDKQVNAAVFKKLLKYCEDNSVQLTVRYGGRLEGNGIWKADGVHYEKAEYLLADSMRSIRAHQVIVSMGTLAHLAVADGKPTVMFDQDVHPHSLTKDVANWHLYKDYRAFPLGIFHGDLRETFQRAISADPAVAEWRGCFIGVEMIPNAWVSRVEELAGGTA